MRLAVLVLACSAASLSTVQAGMNVSMAALANTSVPGIHIIGGSEISPPFNYPFLTALIMKSYCQPGSSWDCQICGATALTPTWVVTAAHCTGRSASALAVEVRRHDLTTTPASEGSKRINVKTLINHENYDASTTMNDIALLELEEPIPSFASFGKVAVLDDDGYDAAGTAVKTAGWGDTDRSGGQSFPEKPHEVGVNVVAHSTCNGPNSYDGSINEAAMVCAASSGKDSCQGDSGGPLFSTHRSDANVRVLVGVVSWGYGCAMPQYPGVYARVSNYKQWLLSKEPNLPFASSGAPSPGPAPGPTPTPTTTTAPTTAPNTTMPTTAPNTTMPTTAPTTTAPTTTAPTTTAPTTMPMPTTTTMPTMSPPPIGELPDPTTMPGTSSSFAIASVLAVLATIAALLI